MSVDNNSTALSKYDWFDVDELMTQEFRLLFFNIVLKWHRSRRRWNERRKNKAPFPFEIIWISLRYSWFCARLK